MSNHHTPSPPPRDAFATLAALTSLAAFFGPLLVGLIILVNAGLTWGITTTAGLYLVELIIAVGIAWEAARKRAHRAPQ